MNILLIIGNGFDKNLGLKTGYSDFIESPQFLSLIDQNNDLSKYLMSKNELEKWIDIENELKIYSIQIFKDNNRDKFKKDYQDLCNALCHYINGIDYNEMSRDSDAYERISGVLNSYESVEVLDFNYTESIDNIIYVMGVDTKKIKHIRVHGSAKEKNIIFGVEDGARINPNDSFLQKSYNDNYCVLVKDSLKSANDILVYGHSLGDTDHSYFEPFFKNQIIPKVSDRKKISITYYSENGKDDVFKQLNELTGRRIGVLRELNDFKSIPLPKYKR